MINWHLSSLLINSRNQVNYRVEEQEARERVTKAGLRRTHLKDTLALIILTYSWGVVAPSGSQGRLSTHYLVLGFCEEPVRWPGSRWNEETITQLLNKFVPYASRVRGSWVEVRKWGTVENACCMAASSWADPRAPPMGQVWGAAYKSSVLFVQHELKM